MPVTNKYPTAARDALLAALGAVQPIVTMSHEDLVVIAVGSGVAKPADYVTLTDEGSDAFEFTELDTGGSVPTVQVKVGLHPLVVLAGETIVGGKQNRVINVSLWLAAKKQTAVPVTCLERGRWNVGHRFDAGRPVDMDMRARVSETVDGSAQFRADQGAVWDEIALKEKLAAKRSRTGALHDLYSSEENEVGAAVKAFPVPEGACGLAVGIGGKVVALDLFDSPETLRKQWPRLIASAASAALDYRRRVGAGMLAESEHRYPDSGALGRMLDRAKEAAAEARVSETVGEGWDVRLAATRLQGSALVHGKRVVHVALFRREPPRRRTPPTPPDRSQLPFDAGRPSSRWVDSGHHTQSELLEKFLNTTGTERPEEEELAGVPSVDVLVDLLAIGLAIFIFGQAIGIVMGLIVGVIAIIYGIARTVLDLIRQ